jgi:hypothetical protein
LKSTFSYDGFANASPAEVSQAAVAVINVVQESQAHVQAHAVAIAFLIMCDRYRIEPQTVFTIVKNLMASAEAGHSKEYRALIDYVTHELNQE